MIGAAVKESTFVSALLLMELVVMEVSERASTLVFLLMGVISALLC